MKRNPGVASVPEPAGRGAAEPAREVLWFNPFSVRPAQLDTRQAGGRARGIGKEPEFLPWAPEGNDTHRLPKPPALTLCTIRNSEKETGSVFVFFFHVSQHKA